MEYKPLPLQAKKKGYDLVQIKRGNKAVVYSGASDGQILKYETFLIKKHDGRKFGELVVDPAEYFPGDECFGLWAWSFGAWKGGMEAALRKFDENEAGKIEEQETEEGNESEEDDAD